MKITIPIYWFTQDTDEAQPVSVFRTEDERFACMLQCVKDFGEEEIAHEMGGERRRTGEAGEWTEVWAKFTEKQEFDGNYFNWGQGEVDVEVPVAASPFQPAPGACVAKLHGDGQVTINPPATSCEIGIIFPEGCGGEVMPYEQAINQFRVYAMMREKVRLWTARGLWRDSTMIPRPHEFANHEQEAFAQELACHAECARVADVLGTHKVSVGTLHGEQWACLRVEEEGEWTLAPTSWVRGRFNWTAWDEGGDELRDARGMNESTSLAEVCSRVAAAMAACRALKRFAHLMEEDEA